MRRLLRFFHTVRHLRPVQIYGRAFLPLKALAPLPDAPAPSLRTRNGPWAEPIARPPCLVGRWRFRFLNEDGGLFRPEDWNDPSRSRLWLYNLHYFDCLASPWELGASPMRRELIARWIADNPPGFGAGWEPYPASLRIANWIKWDLAGERLEPEQLHSLAQQTRWLVRRLEWRLLGNHLLANAKALVMAGLFFEGTEAESWLERGLFIYRRQLDEQVLSDGGHFELSPMYHSIILEDLLDLLNCARVYSAASGAVFCGLPGVIGRMLGWLAAMTHPDGRPSFFNDAAFGVAASLEQLEAYAARLGLPQSVKSEQQVRRLSSSGYVRVDHGDAAAILDLAEVGPPYLPGHAHADALSFELSLGGERVIVNGGTSTYAPGPLRQAERGTAAHSTVEIDGEDSSEMWACFRVGRRARVLGVGIDESPAGLMVRGEHDGYRRLPGRPAHRRSWTFAGSSLRVDDEVICSVPKAITARFHLGPGVHAEIDAEGRSGLLKTAGGRAIRWATTGRAALKSAYWSPQFGRREPIVTLAVIPAANSFSTLFDWS